MSWPTRTYRRWRKEKKEPSHYNHLLAPPNAVEVEAFLMVTDPFWEGGLRIADNLGDGPARVNSWDIVGDGRLEARMVHRRDGCKKLPKIFFARWIRGSGDQLETCGGLYQSGTCRKSRDAFKSTLNLPI